MSTLNYRHIYNAFGGEKEIRTLETLPCLLDFEFCGGHCRNSQTQPSIIECYRTTPSPFRPIVEY